MMIEIQLGEHVAIRIDDDMTDTRLTPEQTEDYLTRMRRTAIDAWNELDTPVTADDTEGQS